jgi:hypothetical protein
MATLSVESITESGVNATYNSAAGGGDQFANNGEVILHIKNSDASSHTVTVTAQQTSHTIGNVGSVTKSSASVAVPASGERFLGPFPTYAFNDSSGMAQITYTSATGMTVAVIKVTKS